MKDKLRDYADRLERGEPWMHKGAKFTKWIKEVVGDMRNDAAILDAEGDGGAVAWMTHHDEPMLFLSREEAATYCGDDEDPISLYTHPTRSGGVSDADVEAACRAYIAADRFLLDGAVDSMREPMRAALEHFVKGEHHE